MHTLCTTRGRPRQSCRPPFALGQQPAQGSHGVGCRVPCPIQSAGPGPSCASQGHRRWPNQARELPVLFSLPKPVLLPAPSVAPFCMHAWSTTVALPRRHLPAPQSRCLPPRARALAAAALMLFARLPSMPLIDSGILVPGAVLQASYVGSCNHAACGLRLRRPGARAVSNTEFMPTRPPTQGRVAERTHCQGIDNHVKFVVCALHVPCFHTSSPLLHRFL
jgi:hypothetical protein